MTSKEQLQIFINEMTYTLEDKNKHNREYAPQVFWKNKYTLELICKDLEVLEILKKKEVAIDELKNCIKYHGEEALEAYNDFAGDENSLTQEEFNKIKEWLEK